MARRYRIDAEIARGGMGVVHRAWDCVLERPVALKRPVEATAEHRERARREAHALRLLQVPGVVQLLDEGEDAEGRFLVTELVDGQPFPGGGEIPGLAAQLLEVLSRVHAAGVLHRDLKPSNVLVDREGRVRVLDFGVARGAALGPSMTARDALVGTPRYLAPEQISGDPVDARADLYAVGLMLFEALAGASPFFELGDSVHARVWRDAPPLLARAPEAPPELARLVDRLLARTPERRPASAAEALVLLGHRAPAPRLRMVGRDAEREALRTAAREGRALGLAGPRGIGRTRLLEEAVAGLPEVVWMPAGERPLSSLRAAFGLPEAAPEACRAAAQARLDGGTVLVVDDLARVDRWSRAIAAELRGAVLGLGPELRLEPLAEADLRALFWGPEAVFHLPEDGAAELHRRARGLPARMIAVLGEWVEAGLARVEGDRVRLEPGAPERLAELPLRAALGDVGALPAEPSQRALLPWIVLGEGEVDVAGLARLLERPAWELGLLVEELADQGQVELRGRVLARPGAEAALGLWTEEERRAAHRAFAALLPPGRARLRHRVAAGEPGPIAEEAREVAGALRAAGRFAAACRVLDTAEGIVRWRVRPALEEGLLRDHVLSAFPAEDLRERELAAEAVRRGNAERRGLLQDLADAAVALARRHFAVAVGLVEDLPELEDEELEGMRVSVLVEGSSFQDFAAGERLLDRLGAWADRPARRGRWLAWKGLVAYFGGRFREAAGLHEAAATLREAEAERLAGQLNAAYAWMDAGELDRAASLAERVGEGGARLRLPSLELRARRVQRAIQYRAAAATVVDEGLLELARMAGMAAVSGGILFTEGLVAWRAGEHLRARQLVAESAGQVPAASAPGVLVRAFQAWLLEDPDRDALVAAAARLPPRLRAQAEVLLLARPCSTLFEGGPGRLEVLSADELRAGRPLTG